DEQKFADIQPTVYFEQQPIFDDTTLDEPESDAAIPYYELKDKMISLKEQHPVESKDDKSTDNIVAWTQQPTQYVPEHTVPTVTLETFSTNIEANQPNSKRSTTDNYMDYYMARRYNLEPKTLEDTPIVDSTEKQSKGLPSDRDAENAHKLNLLNTEYKQVFGTMSDEVKDEHETIIDKLR
ncbi:unnamed protein product, partial [Didymodactylos carnosus]